MWRFLGITITCVFLTAVVGLTSAHRSNAGPDPNTSCVSTSPCLAYVNNGKGEAISGTSTKNNGVHGITDFKSTSYSNFHAGVYGVDGSTSGTYNAGVWGWSHNAFGVYGDAYSGIGVWGQSNENYGILGETASGVAGVVGEGALEGINGSATTTNGYGVVGEETVSGGIGAEGLGESIGILGANSDTSVGSVAVEAQGSGGFLFDGVNSEDASVFSVDNDGDATFDGQVGADEGLYSYSENGDGVSAVTFDPSAAGLYVQAAGGPVILAEDSIGDTLLDLNPYGTLTIAGDLYTAGKCSTGCVRTRGGEKRVISYAPRESQPTMEDVGEAQLNDGTAYVRLDGSFANVIDRGSEYLVFVTPEGDCRQLYVAQRTPQGFVVREGEGGHSSVGFSYRIVAKPYGDSLPRLPMMTLTQRTVERPRFAMPHLPATRHVLPKIPVRP
jgi:hypothetical protein